ncbi:MAG TPA: serine/threonine-protein kinase [Ktedonobacteraceae bacterium]|nr:serine/threonine-protein kinase [Ktedonobacteraceae bacterium]
MVNRSGQTLGHYILIRLIGRGGSADVYLARNLHLRSLCAIKILRTPLIRKGRHKFLEEARIAATLEHEHIVHVLDFDVQNGVPFIVMSYAPHGSLRAFHPRGTKLSFRKTLHYLEQIADALDYLHAQDFIHLDIKPENLLLGRNYEVLLGDFGITETAHKISGSRPGTFSYMAPEHKRGKPCAASDQYALAVCVYEWLTGQSPFSGTRTEVIWQHLHDRPASLRALAPDIPLAMERVVLRALAKNPQQRYASVGAFVDAFREAMPPAPPPATVRSVAQLGLSKVRRWITDCRKWFLTRL